jgi:hypothetical protein
MCCFLRCRRSFKELCANGGGGGCGVLCVSHERDNEISVRNSVDSKKKTYIVEYFEFFFAPYDFVRPSLSKQQKQKKKR